jgi:hypothetical protein
MIAALDMTTQCLGAAGDNSSPRLPLDKGQFVRIEIGLTVVAQNLSQARTVGHDDG